MRDNCEFFENGKCKKWCRKENCTPLTVACFDDKLDVCEMEEVCENASIFGNSLFFLTDEDIEKLKSGKVLFDRDEYGTFIAYKKGGAE
jgi:hypothetical protein